MFSNISHKSDIIKNETNTNINKLDDLLEKIVRKSKPDDDFEIVRKTSKAALDLNKRRGLNNFFPAVKTVDEFDVNRKTRKRVLTKNLLFDAEKTVDECDVNRKTRKRVLTKNLLFAAEKTVDECDVKRKTKKRVLTKNVQLSTSDNQIKSARIYKDHDKKKESLTEVLVYLKKIKENGKRHNPSLDSLFEENVNIHQVKSEGDIFKKSNNELFNFFENIKANGKPVTEKEHKKFNNLDQFISKIAPKNNIIRCKENNLETNQRWTYPNSINLINDPLNISKDKGNSNRALNYVEQNTDTLSNKTFPHSKKGHTITELSRIDSSLLIGKQSDDLVNKNINIVSNKTQHKSSKNLNQQRYNNESDKNILEGEIADTNILTDNSLNLESILDTLKQIKSNYEKVSSDNSQINHENDFIFDKSPSNTREISTQTSTENFSGNCCVSTKRGSESQTLEVTNAKHLNSENLKINSDIEENFNFFTSHFVPRVPVNQNLPQKNSVNEKNDVNVTNSVNSKNSVSEQNNIDVSHYMPLNTKICVCRSSEVNLLECSAVTKNDPPIIFENIFNKEYQNKTQKKNSANILLQDEKLNSMLIEEVKKFKKKEAMEKSVTPAEKMAKISKLIECSSKKKSKSIKGLKRYRKGKFKIYRLRKLKKFVRSPIEEELNVESVLKELSQNFIGQKSNLSRLQSCSSISTSSSYITDETRSEASTESLNLNKPKQKLRCSLNKLLKDNTLLCKKNEKYFPESDRKEILMNIQKIFLRVFDDLTNGRNSVIKYRRQCMENCVFKDERLQFKSDDVAMTSINASCKKSRDKFKLVLYVMKKIQYLLESNTKLTKRELFYQMKDITNNQNVMDSAINIVSCKLGVGMWALNIVAQKGLVFGELKIILSNGETINCNVLGTLIPHDVGEIIEVQSTAYFILVVEKESIFHKLIEENLPNKLTRPFIMITGKGFPDLNTQLFLKKLWTIMSIPVFILVDGDPDGLKIMLNYRFGSIKNAHVSHHLAVPNAKWIGMYPSEIDDLDVPTQPLTSRELKLVTDLLKAPYVIQNPTIISELNVMLKNKRKAGIEALMKSQIYLSEVYLPTKFYIHNFI